MGLSANMFAWSLVALAPNKTSLVVATSVVGMMLCVVTTSKVGAYHFIPD